MIGFSWACSGEGDVRVPTDRLASEEARTHGRALFLEHCALCHGEAADGRGLRRADLSAPPRDLTDPRWRAGTDATHVFRVLRDGLPGTSMPSWRSLSDDDRWDLTTYVLSVAERGA
ncbi:MAG: cytochrome c [Gemmatimonadota bacterium]